MTLLNPEQSTASLEAFPKPPNTHPNLTASCALTETPYWPLGMWPLLLELVIEPTLFDNFCIPGSIR